jgi:hypothetical protein
MRTIIAGGILFSLAAAMPGAALAAPTGPMGFGGQAVADPDAAVDRMIAANTPAATGSGHDRPARSVRNILRDDQPGVAQAYAWMDNR